MAPKKGKSKGKGKKGSSATRSGPKRPQSRAVSSGAGAGAGAGAASRPIPKKPAPGRIRNLEPKIETQIKRHEATHNKFMACLRSYEQKDLQNKAKRSLDAMTAAIEALESSRYFDAPRLKESYTYKQILALNALNRRADAEKLIKQLLLNPVNKLNIIVLIGFIMTHKYITDFNSLDNLTHPNCAPYLPILVKFLQKRSSGREMVNINLTLKEALGPESDFDQFYLALVIAYIEGVLKEPEGSDKFFERYNEYKKQLPDDFLQAIIKSLYNQKKWTTLAELVGHQNLEINNSSVLHRLCIQLIDKADFTDDCVTLLKAIFDREIKKKNLSLMSLYASTTFSDESIYDCLELDKDKAIGLLHECEKAIPTIPKTDEHKRLKSQILEIKARIFDYGLLPTNPDYQRSDERALELYREASGMGSAAAMHNLSAMYRNGQGCTQDLEQAAALLRQAVQAGSESSEIELCGLYLLMAAKYPDDAEAHLDAGIAIAKKWISRLCDTSSPGYQENVALVHYYYAHLLFQKETGQRYYVEESSEFVSNIYHYAVFADSNTGERKTLSSDFHESLATAV